MLEMIWYQRSVDTMVGLPSDVILAACWNILIAEELGLQPGKLVFMLGDTHIYTKHIAAVDQYLESARRTPNIGPSYFNEAKLDTFDNKSISLLNYTPNPPINFEVFA